MSNLTWNIPLFGIITHVHEITGQTPIRHIVSEMVVDDGSLLHLTPACCTPGLGDQKPFMMFSKSLRLLSVTVVPGADLCEHCKEILENLVNPKRTP